MFSSCLRWNYTWKGRGKLLGLFYNVYCEPDTHWALSLNIREKAVTRWQFLHITYFSIVGVKQHDQSSL